MKFLRGLVACSVIILMAHTAAGHKDHEGSATKITKSRRFSTKPRSPPKVMSIVFFVFFVAKILIFVFFVARLPALVSFVARRTTR